MMDVSDRHISTARNGAHDVGEWITSRHPAGDANDPGCVKTDGFMRFSEQ
jgi:hypothetical protein